MSVGLSRGRLSAGVWFYYLLDLLGVFCVYCSRLIMLVFVKKIYLFDFSVFICLSWLAAGLLLC